MTDQRMDTTRGSVEPRITLPAKDYQRLSALARAAMNTMPDLARGLVQELDRAHVLAQGRHPAHIVGMGCNVEFRDETTGRIRNVALVYPEQADISQGKISVLTPVGTALIGLRAGDSITWETWSGEIRRLRVLAVHEPTHGPTEAGAA